MNIGSLMILLSCVRNGRLREGVPHGRIWAVRKPRLESPKELPTCRLGGHNQKPRAKAEPMSLAYAVVRFLTGTPIRAGQIAERVLVHVDRKLGAKEDDLHQ